MIFCPFPSRFFRITQRFGERPSVYKQFGLAGHSGIDFAPFIRGMGPLVVFAPHEGYVTLTDEGNSGYGKYVSILGLPYNKEGDQRRSDLAHLQEFYVKNGAFIAAGDPIGLMGNTGFSDGLHTHWTYKKMRKGETLNKDNGYRGAIDIARYTTYWSQATLV